MADQALLRRSSTQSGHLWHNPQKRKYLLIGATVGVLVLVTIIAVSVAVSKKNNENKPDKIVDHVCKSAAEKIIAKAQEGTEAWQRLAVLSDTYGNRLSGSQSLELAIDWILAHMELDGLDNVRKEPVMVPTWIRGNESAALIDPFHKPFSILGLGNSVSTPNEGLTGTVFVVNDFAELKTVCANVTGKIVLFNWLEWQGYGTTVVYRSQGPAEAAKCGAIAALVKSITPNSLYTPHTGSTTYQDGVPKIPAAAVTVEDALLMQRLFDRGVPITVHLYMEAHFLNDSLSHNVMGEIVGKEFPNQVVVMGGHTDSWDVGQGSMDDAGGVIVSWEALRLLKLLGLQARRTIRAVGWTNEENGLRGGTQYAKDHVNETHVLAIESDGGVFEPTGFGFSGEERAFQDISAIGKLLESIGSGTIVKGGGGADIGPLMQQGVPGAGLNVDPTRYFWYHHTNADTPDKLNPQEMDRCVATMAVLSFCVADAETTLPRSE